MPILRETVRWERAPGKPRYTPEMTPEEYANARRALQILRRRFGTWEAAAVALGAKLATVQKGGSTRGKPSAGLALRVARVAGIPVEDILSGAWPKPGTCPTCGRG